jgi:hypothetical protein
VCRRSVWQRKWTCSHGALWFIVCLSDSVFLVLLLYLLRKGLCQHHHLLLVIFSVIIFPWPIISHCSDPTSHQCHIFGMRDCDDFLRLVFGAWLLMFGILESCVKCLLIPLSVCPTQSMRAHPTPVVHTLITTLFSGSGKEESMYCVVYGTSNWCSIPVQQMQYKSSPLNHQAAARVGTLAYQLWHRIRFGMRLAMSGWELLGLPTGWLQWQRWFSASWLFRGWMAQEMTVLHSSLQNSS